MTAFRTLLALAGAAAATAIPAPAAAQYFPSYGNGYGQPYGGNVLGEVFDNVFPGPYAYRQNGQMAVNECANAAQARLGGYGYGGARVLGISEVRPRGDGGMVVGGVATSGRYGYETAGPVDLTWRCMTDPRGFIRDVTINRAQSSYGSNYNYTPWNDDYSQFGYRRY